MHQTVFNATSTSVLVSDDGRSVGGGDYGTVDSRSDLAAAAIARGELVVLSVPDNSDQPLPPGPASDAIAETRRLQALERQPKADLVGLAEQTGVDPAQRKAELVEDLAAAGATPAEDDTKPTRRRRQQGE